MKTNFTTTVRISLDVKQHLDEMKGKVSASQFISDMLLYFERNGIDPSKVSKGKSGTLVLQGIERIIKIIRAIEKDKIDKLLPVPGLRSDEDLVNAMAKISRLQAELEEVRKQGNGMPNPGEKKKLAQVVGMLEQSFDSKNFRKADKGNDYFVPPVYLEMLLVKIKNICS